MQRQGFSLIECMVYATLLAFMSLLTASWMIRSSTMVRSQTACANVCSKSGLVFDYLAKDIKTALSDNASWPVRERNSIIFNTGDGAIGWKQKGSVLYRTTGIYRRGRWSEHFTSVVERGVRECRFDLITDDKRVRAVRCYLRLILEGCDYSATELIALTTGAQV